jgi:CHAD domain-containing protein
MALDRHKLSKPFRALGKSLEALSRKPSPEEVHALRTRSRRVETVMHALALDQKQKGSRLVRTVESIRKKSGKLRDMDVLTSYLAALQCERDDRCRIELLEYLRDQRTLWNPAIRISRHLASLFARSLRIPRG